MNEEEVSCGGLFWLQLMSVKVYAAELQKYAPTQSQLQDNFQQQAALLGRIQASENHVVPPCSRSVMPQQENQEFVGSRAGNNAGEERERTLQQLGVAHKVFLEVKGNLRSVEVAQERSI